MGKKTFSLSVIVPVYNESKLIAETLNQLFILPPLKEVIVVNDGSTDDTREIIARIREEVRHSQPAYLKNLECIDKQKNEGKGSAICSALTRVNGDVVIIQDADLELKPSDYPRLLEPFETNGADIVFGSRFLNPPHFTPLLTLWANKFLTFFSNLLSRLWLTDMETGYKVFKTRVIKSFPLTAKRFNIEPELAARTARAIKRQGLVFYEIPVSYEPRTYAEGKKISWKDGLAALWWIFYFNLLDQS